MTYEDWYPQWCVSQGSYRVSPEVQEKFGEILEMINQGTPELKFATGGRIE